MTEIFDNAVDSLSLGISHYLLRNESETAEKHAILLIYHSVELFLKEKLAQIHPILIYTNINKEITDNSHTVGLTEILVRYKNLRIRISDDEVYALKALQARRHRIEHYKYEKSKKDAHTIGMALKFIHDFFPSHFGSNLEDHLDEKMYAQVRETIFEYEELLEKAQKEVQKYRPYREKWALLEDWVISCPDCGEETLVMNSDRGCFCFMCHEEKRVEQCPNCGQYVDATELDDCAICDDCFRYKVESDNT